MSDIAPCPFGARGLNRSRGRALRRAALPYQQWMDDGSVLPDDEGPISPEPMIVQHDDRAISHRQRWERTERSATTSASRTVSNTRTDAIGDAVMIYKYIRRARNNSVGRYHVEIFVRPMRYKDYHQAHNPKVVICALFATRNSLKLQGRRKAFSRIRQVRAISQTLYSHS
jgi:hypothetical protein